MSAQMLFHLVLDVERQTMLEKAADLPSIGPMAIADRKEMAMLQPHDVRRGDVCILICFVGIVGCDSALGREGELGNDIRYLALRLVL